MKERCAIIAISLLITLSFITYLSSTVYAADLKEGKIEEELKAIKKEIQDLRKVVDEIKTKITTIQPPSGAEPQEVVVSIDNDPFKGNPEAPVTIIEFSDYQCPFCGRHFKTTMPEMDKEYIRTGKVRYVFRDYPLDFHKQAPKASEAANCAGEQNKYWEMHDKLFENQNAIMVDNLKKYAVDIGLQADSFNACIDSGKYAEEINKDFEDGKKAGVTGTPSFFIGKTKEKNNEILGKKIIGARPYPAFKEEIDRLLTEPGK